MINTPPDWNRSLTAWLAGEDQMNNPPNWVLEKAYEEASTQKPAGNRDAAFFLLQILRSCLLEVGEMRLTPKAREILASMLEAILDGTDPEKAMFLEAKSGHPLWINRARNDEIVVHMSGRISAGMRPAAAAREIAQTEKFRDPKTRKPLCAKTINNIWLAYEKNPHFRMTFSPHKTPE